MRSLNAHTQTHRLEKHKLNTSCIRNRWSTLCYFGASCWSCPLPLSSCMGGSRCGSLVHLPSPASCFSARLLLRHGRRLVWQAHPGTKILFSQVHSSTVWQMNRIIYKFIYFTYPVLSQLLLQSLHHIHHGRHLVPHTRQILLVDQDHAAYKGTNETYLLVQKIFTY